MKFCFLFVCFLVVNQFFAKTVLRSITDENSSGYLDVVSRLLMNSSGKANNVMNFLVETSCLNIRNFCNHI